MTAPISARPASTISRAPRSRLHLLRSAIERRLETLAPPEKPDHGLTRAVRYALLAPGKRIRPILVLLACRELGQDDLAGLDAACALEMVHAASLVLDDLPAMDDAPLRRGRPSTHVAFGQDVAILASVSLLASAFATIAGAPDLDDAGKSRATAALASAIGTDGLAGGQYADLNGRAGERLERVVETNHLKTGVMFIAAIELAGAIGGTDDRRLDSLRVAATHLGHAFQLLDDLQGDPGEDDGKATLLHILGRGDVGQRLSGHLHHALQELRPDGLLAAFVRDLFDVAPQPKGDHPGLPSAARA